MTVSEIAKGIARQLGFRISRNRPQNRFQAIDECLFRLKALGFEPAVIVDVGANRGQFYRIAQGIYPEAFYHLIEPQPACGGVLRELGRSEQVQYHPIALTEPGVDFVRLLGVGDNGGSTGAYVGKPAEHDANEIALPATTLDSLLSESLGKHERTLLKLDVESHELSVLRGAIATIEETEVVLTEVRFFDVENRGDPTASRIVDFLEEHGFVLYDVASLSGRPRDMRLRLGDLLFVRSGSPLLADTAAV